MCLFPWTRTCTIQVRTECSYDPYHVGPTQILAFDCGTDRLRLESHGLPMPGAVSSCTIMRTQSLEKYSVLVDIGGKNFEPSHTDRIHVDVILSKRSVGPTSSSLKPKLSC
jgi:hypothetical protein